MNAISLDDVPFRGDLVHESAKHALQQREKYTRWLDSDDMSVVANAMLIMIGRALKILKNQTAAQGKKFEETGGFSERLMTKRIASREAQKNGEAPECPQCGKAMHRRRSAKGEFWGCPTFPDCKGTRPMGEK